jgi:hypothetical protein
MMNNGSNNNKRSPSMTMQQYIDTDIRRQCMRGVIEAQNNSNNGMKIAGLVGLKKSNSTANAAAAGRVGGWSASHTPSAAAMNNISWINSGAPSTTTAQSRRKSLWFQSSNTTTTAATTNSRPSTSSSLPPTSRHHFKSHSIGSDSNNSSSTPTATTVTAAAAPRHRSKYDGLTMAQKGEIIVNDDIQWLKLQQSLRDHADGLWTSLAVQQVLHIYVQQRIDEMERLESALLEPNGPPSAAAASTDATTGNTITNDPVATAVAEEVGVVSVVKKFARRASQLATQSYLAPQNTTINNNNQNNNK